MIADIFIAFLTWDLMNICCFGTEQSLWQRISMSFFQGIKKKKKISVFFPPWEVMLIFVFPSMDSVARIYVLSPTSFMELNKLSNLTLYFLIYKMGIIIPITLSFLTKEVLCVNSLMCTQVMVCYMIEFLLLL